MLVRNSRAAGDERALHRDLADAIGEGQADAVTGPDVGLDADLLGAVGGHQRGVVEDVALDVGHGELGPGIVAGDDALVDVVDLGRQRVEGGEVAEAADVAHDCLPSLAAFQP